MNRHLHTIDNASRIYEWKMLGRHLNQFYSIGFMLPTWRSENELSTKARMLGSRASLSKWVGWRPVITSFFKIDNEGHLDGSIYSFQFGFIFSFFFGEFYQSRGSNWFPNICNFWYFKSHGIRKMPVCFHFKCIVCP